MRQVVRRIRVEGRVQGVGFRHWTRGEAQALGLAGWVRNEPDGSVLVLASGPEARVDELIAELHRGPPAARVREVEVTPAEAAERPTADFVIAR
jgi:acylphosphatase